ncbi:MAG: hypothetical protein PHY59_08520 [Methanobacterium sp.]|nr:hypothetical protein [Methanobacterium sp.]
MVESRVRKVTVIIEAMIQIIIVCMVVSINNIVMIRLLFQPKAFKVLNSFFRFFTLFKVVNSINMMPINSIISSVRNNG